MAAAEGERPLPRPLPRRRRDEGGAGAADRAARGRGGAAGRVARRARVPERPGGWSTSSGACKGPVGRRAALNVPSAALAAADPLALGGCGGRRPAGKRARRAPREAPHRTRRNPARAAEQPRPPFRRTAQDAPLRRPKDRARITRAVPRYVGRSTPATAPPSAPARPGCAEGSDLPARALRAPPRWGFSRPPEPRRLAALAADEARRRRLGGDDRGWPRPLHRHRCSPLRRSREPSIEDDVIYLRRVGGRWKIAKPSATFYRAIGARDVPIAALRAP